MGRVERRKRILHYYESGFAPSEIVRLVAGEFGCSERTVWRDWGSRGDWMPGLARLDESMVEAFLRMSLELLVLREELLRSVESGNDYAKIRAVKAVADMMFKEFEFARDLGLFEQYNESRLIRNLVNEYRKAGGGDEIRW